MCARVCLCMCACADSEKKPEKTGKDGKEERGGSWTNTMHRNILRTNSSNTLSLISTLEDVNKMEDGSFRSVRCCISSRFSFSFSFLFFAIANGVIVSRLSLVLFRCPIELEDLRQQVIIEVRNNQALEQDVKRLDKKIELLIKNRITLEEVLKDPKAANKFDSPEPSMRGSAEKERKRLDSRLMEGYSRVFYLLQTEPKYLANFIFFLPQLNVRNLNCAKKTLFTVTIAHVDGLYGGCFGCCCCVCVCSFFFGDTEHGYLHRNDHPDHVWLRVLTA